MKKNTKAIIIAAGMCKRLRPLTENLPKCMLEINGKTIIQHTIEILRNNGINDISVIRGYQKEKIDLPAVAYFVNADFLNNNILHSLMSARPKLEEAMKLGEDVVITYSDILYDDSVVKALLSSEKAIASIVDTDWANYYEGRTDHPITEAENVVIGDNARMLKIGKHIFTDGMPKEKQGEFIGLWKFTPEGIRIFLKHFDRLNSMLQKIEPYQNAKEWQKSYITDIFQEMIDKGEELYCVLIQKHWYEMDTLQDLEKVREIFKSRQ